MRPLGPSQCESVRGSLSHSESFRVSVLTARRVDRGRIGIRVWFRRCRRRTGLGKAFQVRAPPPPASLSGGPDRGPPGPAPPPEPVLEASRA